MKKLNFLERLKNYSYGNLEEKIENKKPTDRPWSVREYENGFQICI
jgi:hypothetical protein